MTWVNRDGKWVEEHHNGYPTGRVGIDYDYDDYGNRIAVDYHTAYKPVNYEPYKGFNAKKWPNTFKFLLLAYTLPGWFADGKWSPNPYPDHVGG